MTHNRRFVTMAVVIIWRSNLSMIIVFSNVTIIEYIVYDFFGIGDRNRISPHGVWGSSIWIQLKSGCRNHSKNTIRDGSSTAL